MKKLRGKGANFEKSKFNCFYYAVFFALNAFLQLAKRKAYDSDK